MALDIKTATVKDIPDDWNDDQKAFASAAIAQRDSDRAHIKTVNDESAGRRRKLDIVEAKAKEGGFENLEDFVASVQIVDDDPKGGDPKASPEVADLRKQVETLVQSLKAKETEAAEKDRKMIERGRDASLAEIVTKGGIPKENAEAALRLLRTDPTIVVDGDGKVMRKTKDQYGQDVSEPLTEQHLEKMLPPALLPSAIGGGSGGQTPGGNLGSGTKAAQIAKWKSNQADYNEHRDEILAFERQQGPVRKSA